MTLHWWMHWFWVTALLMLVGSERAAAGVFPHTEEPSGEAATTVAVGPEHPPPPPPPPAPALRAGERRGKAPLPPGAPLAAPPSPPPPLSKLYRESLADRRALEKPQPFNASAAPATDGSGGGGNASEPSPPPPPPPPPVANASEAPPSTPSDNLTRQELAAELSEVAARRRATERPWSLVTEGAAAGERRAGGALDAGAVAGISFATLALAALAGTSGFVLYRRRYLNKPQTLNDKCSNPDSSGYLDDTTVRENSEEMYSLDNDSFLNSLEAMTIQNYWTENVKHSKL